MKWGNIQVEQNLKVLGEQGRSYSKQQQYHQTGWALVLLPAFPLISCVTFRKTDLMGLHLFTNEMSNLDYLIFKRCSSSSIYYSQAKQKEK